MAAALPVSKLAGLLVKTLSKPMAKRIKHECSRYPATQRVLIGIGQTTHMVTSRLTIWSAGYKVRSIKPLEDEKAMAKGADFLGETIVFAVGGGVVVWEYNNSKAKEKLKEQKRLREIEEDSDALQAKLHALDARLKALEKVVKSNRSSILTFGERYVEPEEVNVSIDEPLPLKRKAEKMAQHAGEETPTSLATTDAGSKGGVGQCAHHKSMQEDARGAKSPLPGTDPNEESTAPSVAGGHGHSTHGRPWWRWIWPFGRDSGGSRPQSKEK